MFGPTTRVLAPQRNLVPIEGGFGLIQRDRVEIMKRAGEDLIPAIKIHPEWEESYRFLKEQAAL